MPSSLSKLALTVASATLLAAALPAGAQTPPPEGATTQTGTVVPETSPLSQSEQRKQRRAQRKAARKAAHAKNAADLKKVEGAGYRPSDSNPNAYPENAQDATRKAQGQ